MDRHLINRYWTTWTHYKLTLSYIKDICCVRVFLHQFYSAIFTGRNGGWYSFIVHLPALFAFCNHPPGIKDDPG